MDREVFSVNSIESLGLLMRWLTELDLMLVLEIKVANEAHTRPSISIRCLLEPRSEKALCDNFKGLGKFFKTERDS